MANKPILRDSLIDRISSRPCHINKMTTKNTVKLSAQQMDMDVEMMTFVLLSMFLW